MKPCKYIISGGGTGGHIFPAIAIANQIKKQNAMAKIIFVGARGKMEMEKVPQAGYSIIGLWISGLHRNQPFRNLLFPLKLGVSLVQAIYLLIRIRPDIAIGTGGYASAPMLLIASFFGIKTFIQEQNSYPGITNKFLSKFAHGIAVAYPNLERFFPSEKTYLTGNPVRDKLIDIQGKRQQAYIHFQLDPSKKTLVVLGGSLGAKKVNQIIEENLTAIKKMDIQLVWQCGKIYQDSYMSYDSEQGIRVLPFVKRMDLFYAVADVIISRAGAGTISELCLVGKPCILVPSPNVTENHQYHNARALADQGAAIVIEESHLAKSFLVKMSELLQDQKLQNKMAIAIKDWAKPNATVDIVKKINALIPTK